jgi:hypothetical protein
MAEDGTQTRCIYQNDVFKDFRFGADFNIFYILCVFRIVLLRYEKENIMKINRYVIAILKIYFTAVTEPY